MGKIQQQSLKGGIYSYLGVLIGAITTGFLMPTIFQASEVGVAKLLISYSTIFAQIAGLGFPSVCSRLFTHFRDYSKKHNGFLMLGFIVIIAGFIIASAIYYMCWNYLKTINAKSELFVTYLNYVVFLSFFTLLFNYIDTYLTQLYNAISGVIHKEFTTRLLTLLAIGLFYFNVVSFEGFIILYVSSWSAPGLILLWKIVRLDDTSWKLPENFITKTMQSEMISVSTFGIIMGFSGMAVLNLDSIMLGSMLGDNYTGIYAITFFAGSLIIIPSRALQKISTVYYSDAWKNNDLKLIADIYKKSSSNQYLIGTLILLLLWVNADNLLSLLPPIYSQGKYVILYIGLANLLEMASGSNVVIISTSKHYKLLTIFTLCLMILIVVTNLMLIPSMGIVGAALASLLATLGYNLMRGGYLYIKYKFQPISVSQLKTSIIGIGLYCVSLLFNSDWNVWVKMIGNSSLLMGAFLILTYKARCTEEYVSYAQKLTKKILRPRAL